MGDRLPVQCTAGRLVPRIRPKDVGIARQLSNSGLISPD